MAGFKKRDRIKQEQGHERQPQNLTGNSAKIVALIAILFTLFQLYTAIFGVLDAMLQRSIHLSFGLTLIFLLYPGSAGKQGKLRLPDIALALLGYLIPLYIVINYQQLVLRSGLNTPLDTVVGVLGVLLVLEAVRRTVGLPMLIIASCFIVYSLAGRYIPGILGHRGFSLIDIVSHVFYTTEGIFGIPLGVSSTFIFLFILFGVFLEKTGVGQLFIDLSNAIAGWASGGPAKVAVLSSGFMGTISGSSVANVVGTGSFTIPMMKKLGYRSEFAGAVEATASTGGQLMPPVMGAAAFLMVEFTGESYKRIISAALIPALLYYFGIWAGVHLEAKKLDLRGLKRSQLPNLGSLIISRGHLLIPLLAIVFLLMRGYTAMKAALFAILFSCICAMLRRNTRITFKVFINALDHGARNVLPLVAATACAGIIIGSVTLTGLGLKLGGSLVDLAGGNLFFTLMLTMITSILLGMGVPTTANYVITSTLAAPALLMMEQPITILAAHLFVFYFGIIADITPPVALAAFAASGIAKANPLKTSFSAFKLAIAAFLVPYIFVYNPQLLLYDVTFFAVMVNFSSALIGIIAVSSAVSGYLLLPQKWWERLFFFTSGIMLLIPSGGSDTIGVVGLLVALAIQLLRQRQEKRARCSPAPQ